ncbi:hypothetical protein L596_004807 [Steinernema carpocapsae]|uniref:Uncharacterized protein n=1 Tax=Steinernema carpocapsae TaxID=34508 RepID=A0A4U8UY08_STECR|nr:hypothetical protein L596_004807 [Steinernema carpocapsae]
MSALKTPAASLSPRNMRFAWRATIDPKLRHRFSKGNANFCYESLPKSYVPKKQCEEFFTETPACTNCGCSEVFEFYGGSNPKAVQHVLKTAESALPPSTHPITIRTAIKTA